MGCGKDQFNALAQAWSAANWREIASYSRARRMELGLTQDQVAKLCGVTMQAIAKFETQATKSVGLIAKMGRVFHAVENLNDE